MFDFILKVIEEATRAYIFVRHVEGHLEKGQKVKCPFCEKTADQIFKETVKKYRNEMEGKKIEG
uniref:Uncharacterized protein n=1 Tax=viral metagenome TaxID=1070528 RepID=A0A6M3LFX5_9ZZZZ